MISWKLPVFTMSILIKMQVQCPAAQYFLREIFKDENSWFFWRHFKVHFMIWHWWKITKPFHKIYCKIVFQRRKWLNIWTAKSYAILRTNSVIRLLTNWPNRFLFGLEIHNLSIFWTLKITPKINAVHQYNLDWENTLDLAKMFEIVNTLNWLTTFLIASAVNPRAHIFGIIDHRKILYMKIKSWGHDQQNMLIKQFPWTNTFRDTVAGGQNIRYSDYIWFSDWPRFVDYICIRECTTFLYFLCEYSWDM